MPPKAKPALALVVDKKYCQALRSFIRTSIWLTEATTNGVVDRDVAKHFNFKVAGKYKVEANTAGEFDGNAE